MEKLIVTTWNHRLYKQYAHTFVQTYVQTKQTVPVYVFVDDDPSLYPTTPNFTYINIYEETPELLTFKNKHKDFIDNYMRKHQPRFKFMFDVVRFSHKVFAQYAGSKYADRIFYMDADCVFVKNIPDSWWSETLPDDVFVSFFHRPNSYTETGFIGFNMIMEFAKKFFEFYVDLYKQETIFRLPALTDCHAFDYTRNSFQSVEGYKEKYLGIGGGMGYVMAESNSINDYIDHRKGDDKSRPHSNRWLQAMENKRAKNQV